MAVAPADIPVTRAHVGEWIDEWKQENNGTLKEWIRSQIEELDLGDTNVLTPDGTIPLIDLIMQDIDSYPNASSE
jgi:hypothetical protein